MSIAVSRRAFLLGTAAGTLALATSRVSAAEKLKVAGIHASPVENAWNSRLHEALLAAAKDGVIEYTFSEGVSGTDYPRAMREYAEAGNKLIVGESYAVETEARQVAADYPDTAPVVTRTPIDAESYRLGKWLGTAPRSWQGEAGAEYRAEVREADPIYAREGLVHPGVLQRIMNRVLMENALLGPWIHIGSRMQLLSAVADTDELTARARVTGNYEKKSHLFVELDALIVANGRTPIAHCQHTAIYQPRAQAA